MTEVIGDRSRISRTIYKLDSLYHRLSPHEFGRVMQQVLACSFEASGFRVVENAIGVPDFTATSPPWSGDVQVIAVEVKTTDKAKLNVTQRDLDGISTAGQTGVLAVLMFPSKDPGWLLISANDLSPRSWALRYLRMKSRVDVGCDVNGMLHDIVAGLDTGTAPGGPELESWIRGERLQVRGVASQQRAVK
jgi:hypothetical protein